MTQTQKPEIQSDFIYKVTIKETGKQCFAVPSDSNPGHFYMTCYDEQSQGWTCTCRHGFEMAKVGKDAHCKHQRAAQTSIKANLPRIEALSASMSHIMDTVEESKPEPEQQAGLLAEHDRLMDQANALMRQELEVSQKGHLHSANGFSLMR